MTEITLTGDQYQTILQATDGVVIRNPHGEFVGYVSSGFSPEEIASAERVLDADERRYTTDELLNSLRSIAPEDA